MWIYISGNSASGKATRPICAKTANFVAFNPFCSNFHKYHTMTNNGFLAALSLLMLLAACGGAGDADKATAPGAGTEVHLPEPDADGQIYTHKVVDAVAFKAMIGQPDIVLLDVRTADEIAKGKIEGALELDVLSPDFKDEILKLDRSKSYLVYSNTGNRSVGACNKMFDAGFRSLYSAAGGYEALQRLE